MNKSVVSIVKTQKERPDYKEIDRVVRESLELIGGIEDLIFPGALVLVKPNVCDSVQPIELETTDPRVTKSVALIVRELGGIPIIAESAAQGVDTEKGYTEAGYTKLREEGFEVIDLKKTPTVNTPIPRGTTIKELPIFRLALKADVRISVAKLKTHYIEPGTLSLKNMKGLVPDSEKRKFHLEYGVASGVTDLCTVVKPDLAVIDGLIGGMGFGAPYRERQEMNLILAGKDPVAVDTTAVQVMEGDLKGMVSLKLAVEKGLGIMDPSNIIVKGERVSDVKKRFKTADEALKERLPLDVFNLIINEKACTGCRGILYYSLRVLEEDGELDAVKGKTIVLGEATGDIPKTEKKEDLVLVGKCVVMHRGKGTYVKGCPPNSFDVCGAILGREMKPRWASE